MLRETTLIYRSELAIVLRNKAYLTMGVIQPVLYLMLCGPLLAVLIAPTPGAPASISWLNLTPALVIQVATTNGIFAGYVLLADFRTGALERMRVTPVSRTALCLGKSLPAVALTLVQGLIIIALAGGVFGVPLSVLGVTLSLLIAALTALTLTSCSHALVLKIKNEETFSSLINIMILPLTLLSGILLPITPDRAPTWLYVLSRLNPLAYVVDISRASFRGVLPLGAVALGAVLIVGIAALAVRWNTRTFGAENV